MSELLLELTGLQRDLIGSLTELAQVHAANGDFVKMEIAIARRTRAAEDLMDLADLTDDNDLYEWILRPVDSFDVTA